MNLRVNYFIIETISPHKVSWEREKRRNVFGFYLTYNVFHVVQFGQVAKSEIVGGGANYKKVKGPKKIWTSKFARRLCELPRIFEGGFG